VFSVPIGSSKFKKMPKRRLWSKHESSKRWRFERNAGILRSAQNDRGYLQNNRGLEGIKQVLPFRGTELQRFHEPGYELDLAVVIEAEEAAAYEVV